MIDIDKKVGPLRLRAYGLIVNFLANIIALYGLSKMLSGSGGVILLVIGGLLTLACLFFLATPSVDEVNGQDA